MMLPTDTALKALEILDHPEADFAKLAEVAGYKPECDFVRADLSGVDFGSDKLFGFNFREADLIGADLSRAEGVTFKMIEGAKFDATTCLPDKLQAGVERLTRYWKDGCPQFVSAFGLDEFGQWFEFEIAGTDGPVTQRLRWIAPGKFLMGSPATEADRLSYEGPQHEVTISKGFWMFDTACTQALWQAVMGNNPSGFEGSDRPIETVPWKDARTFIGKINELVPGLGLSLPSEAQWEYACRAGTTTPFSFGENVTPDQVNYNGQYPYRDAPKGLYRQETVPVASLPANDWGLYEMHGNVWEWVEDAWHDNYEGAPTDGSVWDEPEAAGRVVRGGSWDDGARLVRSAYRNGFGPGYRNVIIGFRCARVQGGAEPAETRRIPAERRIAAAPAGGAGAGISTNDYGVQIFPLGAPLVLRGAGERRRVKPAWAFAHGRDEFGDWVEISVDAARQKLRWIPPGKFLMGSPQTEVGRYDDEGPQHEVTIAKGFWLFDTACTQALWRSVMGKNPSRFQGDDRPVEQVSWKDAQVFLKRINKRIPGLGLCLPNEAQWEYACRAGTAGMSYVGDFEIIGQRNAPGLDEIAWYGGNSGKDFDLDEGYASWDWSEKQYDHKTAGTRLVKRKQANSFGLYDMLGNVWEWCADAWHGNYEGAPTDGSVWESKREAAERVVRGGSWRNGAQRVRSAYRVGDGPGFRYDFVGFRCARVQDSTKPVGRRAKSSEPTGRSPNRRSAGGRGSLRVECPGGIKRPG